MSIQKEFKNSIVPSWYIEAFNNGHCPNCRDENVDTVDTNDRNTASSWECECCNLRISKPIHNNNKTEYILDVRINKITVGKSNVTQHIKHWDSNN